MKAFAQIAAFMALAAAAACASEAPKGPEDFGATRPSVVVACTEDLGLGPADCAALDTLVLPESLPAARGSSVGDSLPAAELGFRVFFDKRFSRGTPIACASCHLPESAFGDGKPGSTGQIAITRNSPTILNAAWMSTFFWDGHADTLWSQPLFAFESPDEMNFTRVEIVRTLAGPYKDKYERAFGALPDAATLSRLPEKGKPGDPAFDALSAEDKEVVNRVAVNLGKALEAYMRKVATRRSPLDDYLLGQRDALDKAAKRGLATFVRAGCITCHSGPALSDQRFYALGSPSGKADRGRARGREILAQSPFNASSAYYEGPKPEAPPEETEPTEGAFRTPSLRNVTLGQPYGHDGAWPTLDAVLETHGARPLEANEKKDLAVFFFSLNGQYPKKPWSDWPSL